MLLLPPRGTQESGGKEHHPSQLQIWPLTRGAGRIHRPGFLARLPPTPLPHTWTNCCVICHL